MKYIHWLKNKRLLPISLWLIAIHSFCAGTCLIVAPREVMEFFGFSAAPERFFQVQGGVFHIVMSVAYIMGSKPGKNFIYLVYFAITAKFMATVFLLLYYFLGETIWVILVSGLGDFAMGLLLLVLLYARRRTEHA